MYIVYIPEILGILIYKYIINREFYFRDLLIESYKPSYIYIFISYFRDLLIESYKPSYIYIFITYFRDLIIESYKPIYFYIFISYFFSLIEVSFFGESGFNEKWLELYQNIILSTCFEENYIISQDTMDYIGLH